MECDGFLRRRLRVSPISGYPYLVGTSDGSLSHIYQESLPLLPITFKPLLPCRMEVCQRQETTGVPTLSVTSVPSTDESAVCSMRSAYQFVFRV